MNLRRSSLTLLLASMVALQLAGCATKKPGEEPGAAPDATQHADPFAGADAAAENSPDEATEDAASADHAPDGNGPVDWDAHEKAVKQAEKEEAAAHPQASQVQDRDVRYTQNLIIHYDNGTDENKVKLLDAISDYGAEIVYELDRMSVVVVRIPEGKPIADAIAHFEGLSHVLAVNRDQINDPAE